MFSISTSATPFSITPATGWMATLLQRLQAFQVLARQRRERRQFADSAAIAGV